ncbi:serine/threonine-protein kinase [Mycobacterium servetii]|uniref:non-specific serine/threonine protein kinase n=1 Tax=Mycobacterium servetii TaxID=3237418 RepID=A0ABV4BTD3_9MYCO
MPLASGTTFAGYTIVRQIGFGGMGAVYLAQHPRLPHRAALKILPRAMTADPEFRDRFHREAALAATLSHPNIVRVHDRGEYEGRLWIAMDYVEGTDAGRLIRDHYPAGMPVGEVCAIVTAVAAGLDYAHRRGLLHRGVRPANILLTAPHAGERRILLADFGVPRQLGDVSGLTATNMTVGTVAYAAPEQLTGADIDGRADQYALAANAFHLLTGGPPYQHSPVAVISQHLNAAPPKLSDRRPELASFDPVLSKALAKDPADRFKRCRKFANALGARASVAVGGPAYGSAPRSPTKPPPAAPKDTRGRPAILIGAAIAVATSVATGVIGYMIETNHTASKPTSAAPAAAAVLDGTYRLDYNLAKTTVNGAPNAPPEANNRENTAWWAFRSSCTPARCIATGTKLDANDHRVPSTPADTDIVRFTGNRWQDRTPRHSQRPYQRCLGTDGKSVVAGTDTEVIAWTWEPRPDGTLRGVSTDTVLTNQCGNRGDVFQTPFVATRTGDVPPGVTVADPATVSVPPNSGPAPAVPGPVLEGTYRVDYDYAHQTVNGAPITGTITDTAYFWAFRSSCTSAGCVATGAMLDQYHREAVGDAAEVLHFGDGHWRNAPYIKSTFCPGESLTATGAETSSWSLKPQPDGTLRGFLTENTFTNECGVQGAVYRTPMVMTRIGDVSPTVILADPTLF